MGKQQRERETKLEREKRRDKCCACGCTRYRGIVEKVDSKVFHSSDVRFGIPSLGHRPRRRRRRSDKRKEERAAKGNR